MDTSKAEAEQNLNKGAWLRLDLQASINRLLLSEEQNTLELYKALRKVKGLERSQLFERIQDQLFFSNYCSRVVAEKVDTERVFIEYT